MSFAQAVAPALAPTLCTCCGLAAETKKATFHQNIGMVFARRTVETSGQFCRRCARAYFKSYTLTTLFLGWWGLISLIMTPFLLLNNVIQYFKFRGVAEPLPSAAADLSHPPVRVAQGSFTFKLIYGVAVVLVLLGVLAYNSVDFLEKHAPGVNAQLHSGEITDSSDGEYAGLQIGKDLEAVNAPFKSQEWPEYRKEFLERERYINDLASRNAQLQAAAAKEKGTNVDNCEQISLNMFVPAMNDYAVVLQKTLGVVKRVTTPTKADVAELDELGKQEESARDKIAAYSKAAADAGCNK